MTITQALNSGSTLTLAMIISLSGLLASACGDDYLVPVHSQVFDNSNDVCGHDIALDPDGNIVVLGTYKGSASVGGDKLPRGTDAHFLAKYDPDGTHIWSQQIANSDASSLRLAMDKEGNIVVAGSYFGAIDFGDTRLEGVGGRDVFVVKMNMSGGVIWSAGVGGPESDYVESVEIDTQGNVFLAGFFDDEIFFGNESLSLKGDDDGFVTKLNSSGEATWSARFGGENNDKTEMLSVTPAGKVAMLGEHYEKDSSGELTRSRVIQTYDSNGSLESDWGFLGGAGHIAWANDGSDLYLHGSVDSPQTLGNGTTELSDSFLARIAPGEEVMWSVPGESREWRGMVVDDEDRVHLISDSRTGSGAGRYVWVTSYSKDGSKLGRSEVLTEIGGAQVSAIATGPGGRIVVTGCVREDGFFGRDEKLFISEMRAP